MLGDLDAASRGVEVADVALGRDRR